MEKLKCFIHRLPIQGVDLINQWREVQVQDGVEEEEEEKEGVDAAGRIGVEERTQAVGMKETLKVAGGWRLGDCDRNAGCGCDKKVDCEKKKEYRKALGNIPLIQEEKEGEAMWVGKKKKSKAAKKHWRVD